MPLYDKNCQSCNCIFDIQCRIADKDIPRECPNCGSTDSIYLIGAPTLSRHSERLMTHRKDNGFSEVLAKIKERNPGTNLATGRNTGKTTMD